MSQINLVPYELRSKRLNGVKIRIIIIILVALICFTVIGIILPTVVLNSYIRQETSLKAEINRGSALMSEDTRLQTQFDDYQKYIEMVGSATNLKKPIYGKVVGIEKYIVNDVAIDNLTLENGVINITVSSKEYNSICISVANLQEAEEYKSVRIDDINYNVQQSSYTCTISINY